MCRGVIGGRGWSGAPTGGTKKPPVGAPVHPLSTSAVCRGFIGGKNLLLRRMRGLAPGGGLCPPPPPAPAPPSPLRGLPRACRVLATPSLRALPPPAYGRAFTGGRDNTRHAWWLGVCQSAWPLFWLGHFSWAMLFPPTQPP